MWPLRLPGSGWSPPDRHCACWGCWAATWAGTPTRWPGCSTAHVDGAARGAFIRTLRAVVDWRGQLVTMLDRAYLAERMPTMVMWGDHDGIIPVEHAQLAHAAMPGSRLSSTRAPATSRTTPIPTGSWPR